jgi:hypothetical protein
VVQNNVAADDGKADKLNTLAGLKMNSTIKVTLLLIVASSLSYASAMHPSVLEEVPVTAVSLVISGEILSIKTPEGPDAGSQGNLYTTEYDVRVVEVLSGKLETKRIVAAVTYFARPGVSLKTLNSGLESEMKVGGQYLLLLDNYDPALGAYDPNAKRAKLVRTESLDTRDRVLRIWKR